MKFTFKTEKPTGRYRSFQAPYHTIKLNGITVGSIDDGHPHNIRLMVIKNDITEDGSPNCKWRWVKLKKESESVALAKEWLKQNTEHITSQLNIINEE